MRSLMLTLFGVVLLAGCSPEATGAKLLFGLSGPAVPDAAFLMMTGYAGKHTSAGAVAEDREPLPGLEGHDLVFTAMDREAGAARLRTQGWSPPYAQVAPSRREAICTAQGFDVRPPEQAWAQHPSWPKAYAVKVIDLDTDERQWLSKQDYLRHTTLGKRYKVLTWR